jgi:hypothetical protein
LASGTTSLSLTPSCCTINSFNLASRDIEFSLLFLVDFSPLTYQVRGVFSSTF